MKQSQPKISRHLAYLRKAGIVRARREGKWMHYSIELQAHAGAAAILSVTLKTLETEGEMQADLARLRTACCEPRRFVTLQGAPTPTQVLQECTSGEWLASALAECAKQGDDQGNGSGEQKSVDEHVGYDLDEQNEACLQEACLAYTRARSGGGPEKNEHARRVVGVQKPFDFDGHGDKKADEGAEEGRGADGMRAPG